MIRAAAPALVFAVLLGATPVPAASPTPYDTDLMRLSEILGALSYLDGLCGSPEAALWRERMEALIRAQRMGDDDRRRYVDVFNRGHRTFASVHRTCTSRTRDVIATYFDEGSRLAGRLGERFGRSGGATGLTGD